eukprot:sb/3465755/
MNHHPNPELRLPEVEMSHDQLHCIISKLTPLQPILASRRIDCRSVDSKNSRARDFRLNKARLAANRAQQTDLGDFLSDLALLKHTESIAAAGDHVSQEYICDLLSLRRNGCTEGSDIGLIGHITQHIILRRRKMQLLLSRPCNVASLSLPLSLPFSLCTGRLLQQDNRLRWLIHANFFLDEKNIQRKNMKKKFQRKNFFGVNQPPAMADLRQQKVFEKIVGGDQPLNEMFTIVYFTRALNNNVCAAGARALLQNSVFFLDLYISFFQISNFFQLLSFFCFQPFEAVFSAENESSFCPYLTSDCLSDKTVDFFQMYNVLSAVNISANVYVRAQEGSKKMTNSDNEENFYILLKLKLIQMSGVMVMVMEYPSLQH